MSSLATARTLRDTGMDAAAEAEDRRSCTIGDCERTPYAFGWCRKHYDRYRHTGSPEDNQKPVAPKGEPRRWLMRHAAHQGDLCLIWPFSRNSQGYATVRGAKAARIMCESAHGPAPSLRHQAAHNCGHGHLGCINPRHLRWATPKENAADKDRHGTHLRGAKAANARLTAEQVREMRSMSLQLNMVQLSRRFGVAHTTVRGIISGRTYKDVF